MAVKTQIDVAVDSAAFAEFKAAFDKYSKALSDLPSVWASAEKSTAKTRTNFEATAVSIGVLGGSIASVTARGKEFYQVTTATARHWKDLAVSTHNVARNVIATTESLMKWTGIVSLITGGAGLFGFDRLAGNVANQRSAAFGTGGDRAGRLAFTTSFRRLGDPEGLLGRVSGMQADLKQSVPLRMLGISPDDIRNLPPEEVAMKALHRGAEIASTTKIPVGNDPRLAAFSIPERIWLRDHRAEIEGMIAETRREKTAGRFRLKPEEEKAAQDFETNMSKAGQAIETSFVKGLVKLAAPLGELSDSVVKLVEKFTEKALPDIVKDLGDGIEWLAKEVDKPEFVSEVESLASTIGSLASAFGGILGGLARFARWLGVSSPLAGGVAGTTPESGGGGSSGTGYGHGQSKDQFITGAPRDRGGTGAASSSATGGQATTPTGGGAAPASSGGSGNFNTRGVRNMNPGNIMAGGWARSHGSTGTAGTDQGHGVATFGSWGAGERALNDLALAKYGHGRHSAESMIAAEGGWTPGNHEAAANISRRMGLRPGDDMHLNDPSQLSKFRHSLMTQELGPAGARYYHEQAGGEARGRLLHRQKVSVNAPAGGNTSLSSGAAAAGSP